MSMSIHRLSVEVLSEIHSIYIKDGLGPVSILMLTCKLWYELAIAHQPLWRDLSLCQVPPASLKGAPVTIAGLIHAISRTSRKGHTTKEDYSVPFSLTIGPFITIPTFQGASQLEETSFSRCSSLTLVSHFDFPQSGKNLEVTSRRLFQLKIFDFSALFCLSLHDAGLENPEDTLAHSFACLETSAPNLRRLVLLYSEPPMCISNLLEQYEGIINRIHDLQVTTNAPLVPHIVFPNLTRLDFTTITDIFLPPTDLSELVAPHVTSFRLQGPFQNARLPTPDAIKRLSRLELVEFPTAHIEALYKLMVEGNGGGSVTIQEGLDGRAVANIDLIIPPTNNSTLITATFTKQAKS